MHLPDLINTYKLFLEKNHSRITVKNYISDVNHFLRWFANTQPAAFSPDLLGQNIISEYSAFLSLPASGPSKPGTQQLSASHEQPQESSGYAYKSSKRHLSSLRSFTAFLVEEGLTPENPFNVPPTEAQVDGWNLKDFKNFLYTNNSSDLTVKYYINDVQAFARWYEESVAPVSGAQSIKFTSDIFDVYSRRLEQALLSPKTINRKLSSLRRYLSYLKTTEVVVVTPVVRSSVFAKPQDTLSLSELTIDESNKSYSRIPPVRLVQKLTKPYLSLEDSAANLLSAKIIGSRLRKTFQEGAATKSEPIDNLMKGLSEKNIKKEFYAPYTVSTSEFPLHKKISFHIRHTRPEWYKKYHTYPFVHYIHFAVLVIAATGAAVYLYQNTIGSAKAVDFRAQSPLQKTFVFKGKLLDNNNQPLKEETDLRLGLYTNPTASGSALAWQEVQNSIKPDEDGNITVVIGSKNPLPNNLFSENTPLYLGVTVKNGNELAPRQPIGVPYATTAENVQGLLPITLSDRQTNVLLALDASGKLSIGGEANPVFEAAGGEFTLKGNTVLITTNAGSDGNVVINPSGNGRIDLLQPLTNSTGIVIVEGGFGIQASTSASPAFSINQDGGGPLLVASTAGSVRFVVDSQGTITKGLWAGSPISPEFGGFGANITPATPGEILYSASTTAYGHLRPGIAGQCLTTNGYAAPLWSSCGFLSQVNGTLTLTNNTLDVLLGNTSSGSAKFAFVNMNTGTPTFKVGQVLSLSSNTIEANGQDLNVGGGSTKNVLLASAGGKVGVNTTSPIRNLDVNGSWGGNVDFYSDGAGTRDITRTAPALIYDLEKSTGLETTSTTTYNIVGLPDTDGTFAYLYTKVSKDSSSPETQKIDIKIHGNLVGSVSVSGADTVAIKHFTIIKSNNTWHLLGDPGNHDTANTPNTADSADLAEWTEYAGVKPQPGTLLSIGENGKLIASSLPYDSRVAGVVSTNPRITLGVSGTSTTPLALSGRIPTIVTSINGEMKTGEAVTTSAIPGVGMRLTRSGATIGKTLESFTPGDTCTKVSSVNSIVWPQDDGKNSAHPCFKVPVASFDVLTQTQLQQYGLTQVDYLYIGKVMVLSGLSWSNAEDLISSVDSATISDTLLSMSSLDGDLAAQMEVLSRQSPVVKVAGTVVTQMGAFSGLVAGKIKAGTVIATHITVQNLLAARATIDDLTVTTGLTARKITSPLVVSDTLQANTISPKEKDLTISLPASDSAVVVKSSATNTEIARIDASGNASFAGSLTAQNVNTTDATISGTLRAGNVIAESIDGLDARVSSIAANLVANAKPTQNNPLPNLSDSLASASVSAQFGTFYQGLLSLGASTFGNISVMDQLSLGTTFILSENSINTLGTDLAIQPLRQGAVSFLAGAVRIESDGRLFVNENAVFSKNVAIKGKLETSVISPLPNDDLTVSLPPSQTRDTQFNVKNASGSAVLAVSQKGDITASGSATFSKLNLALVGQALASGEYTATASSSAGTAILKANTTELTIINPLITDKSLIYITPAQNTNNTVLYLMRQTPGAPEQYNGAGSFTVGVSKLVPTDTLFNWLIVN